MPTKKKLIEVALPLEAINAESAREKSIRHGHPSTLHLWWARRPLATARAVIWSSLVDDPSSHPEQFPDEEAQQKERERLFGILTKLVKWENSNDEAILAEAKAEIMKSTDGNPPALLDPFAGGGAIPLEAQRLGLEAHAHDLNPVAVMINKAMIEIPPKFANQPPVNPEARRSFAGTTAWKGAAGLAEDVRYYGEWMKQEAFKRIGHLYPKVKVPKEHGGGEATVIAWIWARTVKCPNPACGCEMPLTNTFVLSQKKGHEAWINPIIDEANHSITYEVKTGAGSVPESPKLGHGSRFRCICCGAPVEPDYIKEESVQGHSQKKLLAIVAEGKKGRIYLSPDSFHSSVAECDLPDEYPDGAIADDKRALYCTLYGLDRFAKLFTNRQLHMLSSFTDVVNDVKQKVAEAASKAGYVSDHILLADGGFGAQAYGDAVSTYLAFAIDKMVDYHSTICVWHTTGEKMANTMRRQGIQMTWDFAECNPFCHSSGCFDNMLEWVCKCVALLPSDSVGVVKQFDAQSDNGLRNIMVSTDPPYYDNIGYADLSDYFYIWLRKSLKDIYPKVFRTMLVPKLEELVAVPYRFGGSKDRAKEFFEDGMYHTLCQVYKYSTEDIPVTVYYAFKQSDTENDNMLSASTGWETMLSAIIRSGFSITGTWPMRTEMSTRSRAHGSNALASSIVLVCRKRVETAGSCTRREFINALHRELRPALEKLQSANIAPVDLAQSAIGPGIGVFSRYKSVLEADGTPMSVRAALQIINQELDAFYNEQEGELDRESRFCVDLFNQYAFNNIKFGDADVLARAKNTSVQALADRGVMMAAKGQVRLLTREEIPEKVDEHEDCTWLLTQQLARAMEKGGVKECAQIVVSMFGSNAENAKALAYRLYTICERKNWAQEGYAYNNLVVAWPDIQSMAAQIQAQQPVQIKMDL